VTTIAQNYFSQTEFGPLPLVLDELPSKAWAGICATFVRFTDRQYFAAEFPELCSDGKGIAGTNNGGLLALLGSHVPDLGDGPRHDEQPDTVTAMDLVVFGWSHAQEPEVVNRHDYFQHDHYKFNKSAGRKEWRTQINSILELNGVALRQNDDGRVVRLGTAAARMIVSSQIPSSGDSVLDDKVTGALKKHESPDAKVRGEALETLWDAFERVKTVIHPTNKKLSAKALIDLMVAKSASNQAVEKEFQALTEIGNQFQIRHHEVGKAGVEPAMVDLLFVRCLVIVECAVRALSRRAQK
jgi:hypothetical protein